MVGCQRGLAVTDGRASDDEGFVIATACVRSKELQRLKQSPCMPVGRRSTLRVLLRKTCILQRIAMTNAPAGRETKYPPGIASQDLYPSGYRDDGRFVISTACERSKERQRLKQFSFFLHRIIEIIGGGDFFLETQISSISSPIKRQTATTPS